MSFQPSDLRGYIKKAAESVQSFFHFLRDKHIFKSFRVTYKVIWNLFLVFAVLGLMGTVFAFGAGAGYFASLVKNEPIMSYASMKKNIYNYTETSEILFAHDVYLGKIPTPLQREEVKLSEVSDYVKEALVATEDQYFYKHKGVVPKAVMRALFQELTNAPIVTGGSTLTQQLVKNQILTPEVSFERKAKEMLYAMRIERFFSKSEILEAYLNVVPFGRNASGQNIAGIQAAAEGVFGVDADELNLPQAAYLAGMPKNPYTYTPFLNAGGIKDDISEGLDRLHEVLRRMLNAGFITKEQYEKAMDYNIRKHFRKPKESTYEMYPYLTTEVRIRVKEILAKQIAEKEGFDGEKLAKNAHLYHDIYLYEKNNPKIGTIDPDLEKNADKLKKDWEQFKQFEKIANQMIDSKGYTIYTTIDKKIYDAMQKAVDQFKLWGPVQYVKNSETGEYIKNPETGKKKEYWQQVGAMLIQNDTGKILSFVPGRDHDKLEVNLATQAYRQNGSSMKPILVYAPAMELGILQPGSIVADLPITFHLASGNYSPHNYAYNYHGLETMRKALYRSHNVPAIKTYYWEQHKTDDPRKFLQKMGVSSMVGSDHLTAAIGGLSKGVSVEENTNAYTTLANGGKFQDAYMIKKIVGPDGKVIYKHHNDPVRVFSPQTAYLMLDVMRDVLGAAGTADSIPGYLDFHTDWAGKTGTTSDLYDEWFVATNPNVTLGVWTGYKLHITLENDGNYPDYNDRTQLLWASFANAAYKVRPELMDPKERFHMPTGIVRRTVCKVTGMLPSDLCREAGLTVSDLFNAKYAPNQVGHALGRGYYVTIDGEKYVAGPETPKAFRKKGLLISEDFLDKHYLGVSMDEFLRYTAYYNSDAWEKLMPAKELPDSGKPAPVSGVRVSGGVLHWNAQSGNTVGYRIYQKRKDTGAFIKVATVNEGESLTYPVQKNGAYAYYVTAVSVSGQESGISNVVKVGDWTEPKPDPKPKPKDNDGNGGDTGGDDTTSGGSAGETGGSGDDGSNTGDTGGSGDGGTKTDDTADSGGGGTDIDDTEGSGGGDGTITGDGDTNTTNANGEDSTKKSDKKSQ
ncbi:MAG TPA: transglycosylase domain-containing protein [Bacillales bacterium]|nr:transglycosylase domain-containing protein [Bacillales bacterium]